MYQGRNRRSILLEYIRTTGMRSSEFRGNKGETQEVLFKDRRTHLCFKSTEIVKPITEE